MYVCVYVCLSELMFVIIEMFSALIEMIWQPCGFLEQVLPMACKWNWVSGLWKKTLNDRCVLSFHFSPPYVLLET